MLHIANDVTRRHDGNKQTKKSSGGSNSSISTYKEMVMQQVRAVLTQIVQSKVQRRGKAFDSIQLCKPWCEQDEVMERGYSVTSPPPNTPLIG